jgi:hypothetical protein
MPWEMHDSEVPLSIISGHRELNACSADQVPAPNRATVGLAAGTFAFFDAVNSRLRKFLSACEK